MHHPSDYQGGAFPDGTGEGWRTMALGAIVLPIAAVCLAWHWTRALARIARPSARVVAHAGIRAGLGVTLIGLSHAFDGVLAAGVFFIGKMGLGLAAFGLIAASEGAVASVILDRLGIKKPETN